MSDKKFGEECLKVHNEYRKRHQVAPMKYVSEIAKIAQSWADHLAQTDTFQHSRDRHYKGEQLGENIAMKWTSTGDDFTGGQVADQWYSEIERYNFSTHGGPSTGHFTQVVWKDTKEFGVGRAKTKDGKWLVVANYYPAGNFLGKNGENVLPPKDGETHLIGEKEKGPTLGQKITGIFKKKDKDGTSSSSDSDSDNEKNRKSKKLSVASFDGQSTQKTITTREEILPDGRKKTTVTETTVGADGKKSTTTRETISNAGEKRSPPPKKKIQDLKDFVEEVIKEHNKHRKAHGKVGDLKHNKDLDVLAQRWAEHLAVTNDLKYSNDTYKGEELGENIASKWATGGADYTGEEVCDQWYKEHEKFNFTSDHQPGTGHFTQMVWDASKEIGVGKAHSKDGRVFVVCNYYPPGNVLGKFRDNVKPK